MNSVRQVIDLLVLATDVVMSKLTAISYRMIGLHMVMTAMAPQEFWLSYSEITIQLTHWGWVVHIYPREMGYYWFR